MTAVSDLGMVKTLLLGSSELAEYHHPNPKSFSSCFLNLGYVEIPLLCPHSNVALENLPFMDVFPMN